MFRDRQDAGQQLAAEVARRYRGQDVRVLGLPRGGVPVAFEVARTLGVPLDIMVVRKLGLPQHAEFAMGAIATGGVTLVDEEIIETMRVSREAVDAVIAAESAELERREKTYRAGLPALDIAGRTIILVDDGLATGATMRAAIAAARTYEPRLIVAAVPVAAAETCDLIRSEADDAICLQTPADFRAVGAWYQNFSQTTDEQVQELLARARKDR